MRSLTRRLALASVATGVLLAPVVVHASGASGAPASAARPYSQAAGTYGLSTGKAGPLKRSDAPCGGDLIPKWSGGYWTCTFDDEFNGTALDASKWMPVRTDQYGFHSGQECFVDSPNNISVSRGYLNLTARKESAPFTCTDPLGNYTTQYTSGSVASYGRFSQAYGRFAVRAKFPAATVAGLQSALWLYPNTTTYGPWPASGEIDIAEAYSRYPDRAIPYVHYDYDPATANPATNTNVPTNNFCLLDASKFHEYVLQWTPLSMTIAYDGVTCMVDNWVPSAPLARPQPFDQPFYLVLTQALGIGANAFDPATTPLPAITQVDYVRAWS